jgi:hypothetical protein
MVAIATRGWGKREEIHDLHKQRDNTSHLLGVLFILCHLVVFFVLLY